MKPSTASGNSHFSCASAVLHTPVCHRFTEAHLEIVKRSEHAQGFELLKKRWIIERTLGWFGWYRRLSKDYEELTVNSEAMILVCMIHRMLRHLKPAELACGWEK
jgi:transposase